MTAEVIDLTGIAKDPEKFNEEWGRMLAVLVFDALARDDDEEASRIASTASPEIVPIMIRRLEELREEMLAEQKGKRDE